VHTDHPRPLAKVLMGAAAWQACVDDRPAFPVLHHVGGL
jgi:hypothetical protein